MLREGAGGVISAVDPAADATRDGCNGRAGRA
jgi:hypothetical protein